MDRTKRNNSSSCEFANNLATNASSTTTTANNSTTAPWSNNKESPPNEEDSNEDDTDNASPAKVTDPLAPKYTNNEVIVSKHLITIHKLKLLIHCSRSTHCQ